MTLGLAGALAAAVCYGFGSVLQASAAERTDPAVHGGAMVLVRLLVQWRYLCGLGLDLAGFGAAILALRTLPLFVVQASVASSVGVTAVAASRLLHVRLATVERRAILGLVVGLVLLGAAGRPEHAIPLAEPGPILLLSGSLLLAMLALAATSWPSERTAPLLAAGAGIAFGAVGIAARAFSVPHHWADALRDPLLYAIAAHGLLATLLFAAALQRGKVTTVVAVTFAIETIVPAAIGVAWLGDRARAGMAPVAGLGFVATVAASIALARFAEPPTGRSLR